MVAAASLLRGLLVMAILRVSSTLLMPRCRSIATPRGVWRGLLKPNRLRTGAKLRSRNTRLVSFSSSSSLPASSLPPPTASSLGFPSLIVFDLDNTLWTPELYQLRNLQKTNTQPIADKDVKMFPAIRSVIRGIQDDISQNGYASAFANTKFAVASRTRSVEWAHDLLSQFNLDEFFDFVEIFPADKKQHFANLKEKSGIEYHDMLFFDDSRDGRFGNCVPVSDLGVLSVHCPNGIFEERIWTNALGEYRRWYVDNGKPAHTIVEWDGSVTTAEIDPSARYSGVVQTVKHDKNFGFIRHGDRSTNDVFFHFSVLPAGGLPEVGDEVTFGIAHDSRKGKDAAKDVRLVKSDNNNGNTIEMRAFSMNLPFAALLANGYKTLETRNGTMFTPYEEGTKMLLHVGQRIYPDGNRHLEVMKSGGLDDDTIQELKSLPQGYSKGMAVAIVEIGKTFETTLEERCDPDFQRSVGAFGSDSGMRATEIRRVEYLKKGVRVSARGGVFKAVVDRDVIPDGWLD